MRNAYLKDSLSLFYVSQYISLRYLPAHTARTHIGDFRQYSKYLSGVLKVYLILIIVIGIFGGYKILTDYTPAKKNRTTIEKLDF
jgi:hypothetical protein